MIQQEDQGLVLLFTHSTMNADVSSAHILMVLIFDFFLQYNIFGHMMVTLTAK